MLVRRHDDLAVFAELVTPLLHADPLRHNGIITLLAAAQRPDPPWRIATMATVHDEPGAEPMGAVLRTVERTVLVSALPVAAAGAVADVLAETDPDVPGVVGPKENAEAFAAAWSARTGFTTRLDMALRLFVLDVLRPPDGVPGTWRVAGAADVDHLARWRTAFFREALPASWAQDDDPRPMVVRHLASGQGNVLWELDGRPVSMAVASPPAAGMSRIGPVWTPPEHRGNGFGSAVTAACARWALDAGAERVVLFTDLTNPTSNSIYRRIGFRAIGDHSELAFERP